MYIYSKKELAKRSKKEPGTRDESRHIQGSKEERGITTTVALRPTESGEIERDNSWGIRWWQQ
jgi:hypothetical protein